jgi:transcriptional regulator with XRE-family HTH domain
MSDAKERSLLEQLTRLTGQVAGQTLDVARSTAATSLMFGENWLQSTVLKNLEPERLQAMADAGHFLRDARETAGMSLRELTDALGLKDDELLRDIESGDRVMPLELAFRSASLIARHDPIPFLVKFMRTYNPSLGDTLEQWGIMALPVQFERERRWINLYRKHDTLRTFSDEDYDRLIDYVDAATQLILDVMVKEKAAAQAAAKAATQAEAQKAPAKKPRPRVEVEAVTPPPKPAERPGPAKKAAAKKAAAKKRRATAKKATTRSKRKASPKSPSKSPKA